MRRHLSKILVPAAMWLAGCATTSNARPPLPDLTPAPPGTLTVGLTASVAGADKQSAALSAFVKSATGHEVRPALFPDYDSLANAVAQGQVDVALLPPLAYVRAQTHGPAPVLLGRVVRNGQTTYRSVLFARAGSPLKGLDELKKASGLKAAWVDASSATGYIFPKSLLIQLKVDPAGIFVAQDFLGTHDAVCKAVADGKADLGASFTDDPGSSVAPRLTGCEAALGATPPLQIVLTTPPVPNDALTVKAGFPDAEKDKLVAATAELSRSEAGKATLKAAFLAEGMAPVADADYQSVRDALDVFRP
jgi:phosphonate transport system substrate-binding protein